jgi:hypothetical protein
MVAFHSMFRMKDTDQQLSLTSHGSEGFIVFEKDGQVELMACANDVLVVKKVENK